MHTHRQAPPCTVRLNAGWWLCTLMHCAPRCRLPGSICTEMQAASLCTKCTVHALCVVWLRRLMRWVCWRHMRLRLRWHLDVLCIGGAGRVRMHLVLVEVIVVDAISVRIITVHRCPASADGFFCRAAPPSRWWQLNSTVRLRSGAFRNLWAHRDSATLVY